MKTFCIIGSILYALWIAVVRRDTQPRVCDHSLATFDNTLDLNVCPECGARESTEGWTV